MFPLNKDGSPWSKEAADELCRVMRSECREELLAVPKYKNGIPADVVNDLYLSRLATYCKEPKDEKDERKRLRLDRRSKDLEDVLSAAAKNAEAAEDAIRSAKGNKVGRPQAKTPEPLKA
jgi:hypothetical protein